MSEREKSRSELLEEIRQLRAKLESVEKHPRPPLPLSSEELSTPAQLAEERFFQAMCEAKDGVWNWNLKTGEVYFSPRWKNLFGCDEVGINQNLDIWLQLIHPDDRETVWNKINNCLEARSGAFETEARMSHKDGRNLVIHLRGFIVPHDEPDLADRLICTHTNITQRTESDSFIRATSEILKMIATRQPANEIYNAIAHLYESRHPGIRCSMLTLKGNKMMYGGAPSLPKAYCDVVNGMENGPMIGSCGTATYYGKRVLVENIETDPKWANYKDFVRPFGMKSCWSEPVKSSTGEILGAFGMYRDYPALPTESEENDLASAARLAGIIMEREKSEIELNQHKNHLEDLVTQRTKELEEAREEAVNANLAKSQFLSSMSHELRTPLNAIIGFGQILSTDLSQEGNRDQCEALEHILKSGEHLLQLINEILDLSQIETGKISLSLQPINLNSVIRETIALVQSLATRFDIQIISERPDPPGRPNYVVADRLRIKQVLLNLLSNGIKYNQPGGRVKIEVIPGSEFHKIVVEDTGLGIEKKHIEKLFEPFNRLGAEVMEIEGTGIGLTITKRLTEVMEGTLSIETEPGIGSAFTVSFPASPEPAEVEKNRSENRQAITESSLKLNDEKILYIEDNCVNIKLVQQVMKRYSNVRLLIAQTGQEGIDLAVQELPALILLDMHLPDMNGRDALKVIKKIEKTASIPVVGVSADAMVDVVQKSESEGLSDYVTKPFNIDHFLEVVQKYLGNKNDRQISERATNLISKDGETQSVILPS